MSEPFHTYEPRAGHRLPHDPFNMIVGPRPIGWIGSKSTSGVLNLAPYSFFNAFNYKPPVIGFASSGDKDTLRNVRETGEFTWNLVTRHLAQAMNKTSASLPPQTSEFEIAELAPAASTLVAAPRVADSPVSFECRATQILQLCAADGQDIPTWLVLGEVLKIYIAERLLKDGIYDTAEAGHVLRGGGTSDYFLIGPEDIFQMTRPQ